MLERTEQRSERFLMWRQQQQQQQHEEGRAPSFTPLLHAVASWYVCSMQFVRTTQFKHKHLLTLSTEDGGGAEPLYQYIITIKKSYGRSTPVAQLAPRNLLTRWDVSSIPANGIFLTKN